METGLITIKKTFERLGVSESTFHRNRAFYVAHGLQIKRVKKSPMVVSGSIDRMIKNLPDFGREGA